MHLLMTILKEILSSLHIPIKQNVQQNVLQGDVFWGKGATQSISLVMKSVQVAGLDLLRNAGHATRERATDSCYIKLL